MPFVPLRIYSPYSLLRSALTVQKIGQSAKKFGYGAIGVSDYQSLSGYPDFFHTLEGNGIGVCYGYDLPLGDGLILSLYAKDEAGYRSLIALNLLASERPITRQDLLGHAQGLIYVLPAEDSPLRLGYSSNPAGARDWLVRFQEGLKPFYVGVPYLPHDPAFLDFVRDLGESYSYDLVAFPHICYQKRSDAIALEIVKAIESGSLLHDREKTGDEFFLSPEEASAFYTEGEIANTQKIFDGTREFHFLQKRGGLLQFPTPHGESAEEYLKALAEEGLRKRKPDAGEEYKKRLSYELSVIDEMGYADYFLIVQEYVNWARRNGYAVGPGRGSAGGSLVAYALGIIIPDPIEHGLFFERFLNPSRKTMPDIDVDFGDQGVVAVHLQELYGKDRVAHIMTLQTIGAKEAIRDVGRVYDYPRAEVDRLAKAIRGYRPTLADAYRDQGSYFRELVDKDRYYQEFVHYAHMIEGLPRQTGLHAAGVVLSKRPLVEGIPVYDQEGTGLVASFEKDYIEEQGYLKMDLLGIDNLQMIQNCLALIKEHGGPTLRMESLPHDDPEAIAMIRAGKTMGIFQLDSATALRTISEIQPNNFSEVAAVEALGRPGPMKNIPLYARRKKGLEKISYPSPELEPILRDTYGVIVYQEQVMQIAQAMAGFSLSEADTLRRAMSKKDMEKMASAHNAFLAGCKAKGHDEKTSEMVYQLIASFAEYGFNKSHAICYAWLSCQEAYLKRHYPEEFYTAYLNSGHADPSSAIDELQEDGYQIACPDVNVGGVDYLCRDHKLYFPLSRIKTFPSKLARDIVSERSLRGPFLDLFDFAKRMYPYGMKSPQFLLLAKSGALDGVCPGYNRASIRENCPAALNYASLSVGEGKQGALFEIEVPKPRMFIVPDDPTTRLFDEQELLGLMLSGSPLDLYENQLKGRDDLITLREAAGRENGRFYVAAVLSSARTGVSKKSAKYAFLRVYDRTGTATFAAFGDAYDKILPYLKANQAGVYCLRPDFRKGRNELDGKTYVIEDFEPLSLVSN